MTGADSLGCERTRTVSLQVVSRFGAADAGAATATTAAVAAAMLTPANAALRPLSRSLGMCPYLSRGTVADAASQFLQRRRSGEVTGLSQSVFFWGWYWPGRLCY